MTKTKRRSGRARPEAAEGLTEKLPTHEKASDAKYTPLRLSPQPFTRQPSPLRLLRQQRCAQIKTLLISAALDGDLPYSWVTEIISGTPELRSA